MDKLYVRAKHFKDSTFIGKTILNEYPEFCPLEKCAMETFSTDDVTEGTWQIIINRQIYDHEYYGLKEFEHDLSIAQGLNFSDNVIRKIHLTKSNNNKKDSIYE